MRHLSRFRLTVNRVSPVVLSIGDAFPLSVVVEPMAYSPNARRSSSHLPSDTGGPQGGVMGPT